jgi:hypothetical protein
MVKIESLKGKNRAGKEGEKDTGQVCGESIETDGQQKKEQWLGTNLSLVIISTEGLVLTDLTHPGDQELFLRKLGIESLDSPAAGHADMGFHLGDSVWKYQERRSGRDIRRVRDRELVAHAVTFLALTSFRYPHVLQLAFCEFSA